MMLRDDLLQGRRVRLGQVEPDVYAKAWARWGRNTAFYRNMSEESPIPWSIKKHQEWAEQAEPDGKRVRFHILARPDDRFIGFVGLYQVNTAHRDAWLGVGIGEAEYWSRGYGGEAMRLMLDYAFLELNLYRVTLDVFAYNARAIHLYEKLGFRVEGRERRWVQRDGERVDLIHMGILRREWLEQPTGEVMDGD